MSGNFWTGFVLIFLGVGDWQNVVATDMLLIFAAPPSVRCDRRLGPGLFAVTAFEIASLSPEYTASLSDLMIAALRPEYTAALSDPMIAALRPEYSGTLSDPMITELCSKYTAAPSDSMLAALLQQLNLASLVTGRAAEDIA